MVLYRIDVEVVAPVYPTEDSDRVAEAIRNLFPMADVEDGDGEVLATSHSVERFAELVAEQRIRQTARTQLLEGLTGDTLTFRLRKQAATVGVVNFALDEPGELGDLTVSIRIDYPDPEQFIELLTAPDAGDVASS